MLLRDSAIKDVILESASAWRTTSSPTKPDAPDTMSFILPTIFGSSFEI